MIKQKLENILRNIKKKPIKLAAGIGLSALIATTAIKDNVHFGSVNLHNPKENHYVWGLSPTTRIDGKANGNFYTFGLLLGKNNLGSNSTITGNMKGYGLLLGINDLGSGSTITGNMNGYGLFWGVNDLGDNSTITGNITSKGLIADSGISLNVGSNAEVGLEKYVHKSEKKK